MGVRNYLTSPTESTVYYGSNIRNQIYNDDPNWRNVSLLLQASGTNGAQNNNFLDSSSNNFTITRNGNTTQGSFSPYGDNWSNYFDGNGDYLSLTLASASGSSFTAEFWVYITSYGSDGGIISTTNTANTPEGWLVAITNTGKIIAGETWGANAFLSTGTVPLNTWTHVAVVRNGTGSGNAKIYLNGTVDATTGTFNKTYTSTSLVIGRKYTASNIEYHTGYISNIRVSNNARYTSNFTVGTQPLTSDANTTLLTCQSNRFRDNSSNAFAITRNGDVSVQRFSPFAPSAYSTSTIGGSGYFDGTGDYLTSTASSELNLSTGDWTIQGWFYPTAYSALNNVLVYVGASSGDKLVIATIGTAGSLYYLLNGSVIITSSTAAPLNTWAFFALVKSGSTTTLYLNGVSLGTTTSVPTSSNKSLSLGADAGSAVFQGYLSDVRILKGTASTSIPTAPLTAVTNTSLLLNFTNTSVLDKAMISDIEPVGNASPGSFSPYGDNWSNHFDGTGDYLDIGDSTDFEFGSGSFTIEAWVNPSAIPSNFVIAEKYTGGNVSQSEYTFRILSDGRLRLAIDSSGGESIFDTASGLIATGKWYHCAAVRSGNSFTLYIDGVARATGTSSVTLNATATPLRIGDTSNQLNGYVSDLRILKGTALYTSNFTPPTTPLTAITNTSLLTCQSNRFRDNSTNNFTITRNGDVSVQRFTPFTPTTYSPDVIGGSMYFDGSGDYLKMPTVPNYRLGSGNFTIEFWFYQLSRTAGEYDSIFRLDGNGIQYNASMYITIAATGFVFLVANNAKNGWAINLNLGTLPSLNAWHHIAIVRNGSSWVIYLNGSSVGSTTYSGTVNDPIGPFEIGWAGDSLTYFDGYIDDFRILKGTALYTSNFTPPTAPLTAVTNTSLLLNFTEGKAIDQSMNNNLEMVGNAQISSTQSKFDIYTGGGRSFYFDGSGDVIRLPFSPLHIFGSSDFTVECWVYINSLSAAGDILSINSTSSGGYAAVRINITTGGALYFLCASAATTWINSTTTANSTVTTNVWYHIAAVRSGTNFNLYVNGESKLSYTSSSSLHNASGATYIGAENSSGSPITVLNGYIDNLRITRAARYTQNFTPPVYGHYPKTPYR